MTASPGTCILPAQVVTGERPEEWLAGQGNVRRTGPEGADTTMKARPMVRWVLPGYLALVLLAMVIAAVRLSRSTAMPGLEAIELAILALPWSFALGVEPTARLGWGGMASIVFGGVILNALLIRSAAHWAQRHWSRRA